MPNAAPQSRRIGVFATILAMVGMITHLNAKAKVGERKRSENINTIQSRLYRNLGRSLGKNQRKQRKAIRQNPSLLRSKRFKHKSH